MAPVNGYCTGQDVKDDKRITSADAGDDTVIDGFITAASRRIDAFCGHKFFARTETRWFDTPALTADGSIVPYPFARELRLDDDLLTVTTITNGDGIVLPSTEYILEPYNLPHKQSVRIKRVSSFYWSWDPAGNVERVISIAGSWGFVDRTATDATSVEIIANTKQAAIDTAIFMYGQRFGHPTEQASIVTNAGVIMTPAGALPKSAWDVLKQYKRGPT